MKRNTSYSSKAQIQFALEKTIYNTWIFDKEVKPTFTPKKKDLQSNPILQAMPI